MYVFSPLPLVSYVELLKLLNDRSVCKDCLAQGSYVPWNFLGDRSVFQSNEAILGGHKKDQSLIRNLEPSALAPFSREGKDWAWG